MIYARRAAARAQQHVDRSEACKPRDYHDDGFWTGCLTVRRAKAQQDAACSTAVGYRDALVDAAMQAANQLSEPRKQYRCAVVSGAREVNRTIETTYDQLVQALQSAEARALGGLRAARDRNLAAVDDALAATLHSLSVQERTQRQAVNDSGYLQQLGVERVAHATGAGLAKNVQKALDSLLPTLEALRAQVVGQADPDPDAIALTLSVVQQNLAVGMGTLEGKLQAALGDVEQSVHKLELSALKGLTDLTLANDQSAAEAERGFARQMANLGRSASATLGQLASRHVEQVTSSASQGAISIQGLVTGFTTSVNDIYGRVTEALRQSQAELDRGLAEKLAPLDTKIRSAAWKAASKEKPAWVGVLAVVLIIAVIIGGIAISIATLGAGAGFFATVLVGALVGAASAGLIQIINNVASGADHWYEGVGTAMIMGAIGGAIGGGLGYVAGSATALSGPLMRAGASMVADLGSEAITQAIGVHYFHQQWDWRGFLMAGAMSGISSVRGARAHGPHGSTPHPTAAHPTAAHPSGSTGVHPTAAHGSSPHPSGSPHADVAGPHGSGHGEAPAAHPAGGEGPHAQGPEGASPHGDSAGPHPGEGGPHGAGDAPSPHGGTPEASGPHGGAEAGGPHAAGEGGSPHGSAPEGPHGQAGSTTGPTRPSRAAQALQGAIDAGLGVVVAGIAELIGMRFGHDKFDLSRFATAVASGAAGARAARGGGHTQQPAPRRQPTTRLGRAAARARSAGARLVRPIGAAGRRIGGGVRAAAHWADARVPSVRRTARAVAGAASSATSWVGNRATRAGRWIDAHVPGAGRLARGLGAVGRGEAALALERKLSGRRYQAFEDLIFGKQQRPTTAPVETPRPRDEAATPRPHDEASTPRPHDEAVTPRPHDEATTPRPHDGATTTPHPLRETTPTGAAGGEHLGTAHPAGEGAPGPADTQPMPRHGDEADTLPNLADEPTTPLARPESEAAPEARPLESTTPHTPEAEAPVAKTIADHAERALSEPPRLQDTIDHVTGVNKGPHYEEAQAELRDFYHQQELEAQQVHEMRGAATEAHYAWDYGADVQHFSHGVVQVTYKVHLDAPGVPHHELEALKANVIRGVDEHYNFPRNAQGEIERHTVRGPNGEQGKLHLNVEFVPRAEAHTSVAVHRGDGDANAANWFVEGHPTTHAHEIGHSAFGLKDEYAAAGVAGRSSPTDVNVRHDASTMSDYWERLPNGDVVTDANGRPVVKQGVGFRDRHREQMSQEFERLGHKSPMQELINQATGVESGSASSRLEAAELRDYLRAQERAAAQSTGGGTPPAPHPTHAPALPHAQPPRPHDAPAAHPVGESRPPAAHEARAHVPDEARTPRRVDEPPHALDTAPELVARPHTDGEQPHAPGALRPPPAPSTGQPAGASKRPRSTAEQLNDLHTRLKNIAEHLNEGPALTRSADCSCMRLMSPSDARNTSSSSGSKCSPRCLLMRSTA